MMENRVLYGDSYIVLDTIDENSIDCVVTDPPYSLEFQGMDWDKCLPSVDLLKKIHRVMKPGAFAFIMASPRQDLLSRMIVNLQDAGFETGFTSLYWTYFQGMPKSFNISKAVDKKFGAKRKVIGKYKPPGSKGWNLKQAVDDSVEHAAPKFTASKTRTLDITEAATEEAKELEGAYSGFNPKPAVEVVIVVMKPLSEKNYLEQALYNKKGITWLERGRIPLKKVDSKDVRIIKMNTKNELSVGIRSNKKLDDTMVLKEDGRFPANILVEDDVLNDGGETKSGQNCYRKKEGTFVNNKWGPGADENGVGIQQKTYPDQGSHSRYFDLDAWWEDKIKSLPDKARKTFPFLISSKPSPKEKNFGIGDNKHVTVKPIKLMSYLIAIGSCENDIVLDPFLGSGTTAMAAKLLNRKYIGIERDKEYYDIAKKRVESIKVQLEIW